MLKKLFNFFNNHKCQIIYYGYNDSKTCNNGSVEC